MLSQTLPWSTIGDVYHFTVMIILISAQISKIVLLKQGQIFLTLEGTLFGDLIIDSLEGFVHSPRFMSILTVSLLYNCNSIKPGKKTSAVMIQSLLIKFLPYFIAVFDTMQLLMRRNFVMTADDWLFCFLFCSTI